MLSPDLSILGHDRNQIIWQVSSNNNMSGATEYTTNSYTFQNPTVPIFQNGIEITSYVPPGVFLAPLAVGTYYMRFRIGQSNWSDIIQVSILPPPIF